ncbi:MAG: hypothetical protein SOX89_05455 [Treponema sp.]|nr:hypothetical protein [Treponema sp.]
MKRRFNFLKALLPFILAIGTFSACDQDSPGVKITVKNWPEHVTEISFGDANFQKNEINLQKESNHWVGNDIYIHLWYEESESEQTGIYGTLKDKENFKVFVNGKEIQNEAEYLESDDITKKTNLITYFESHLKAEAEMELSFEGFPEKINPKDVRLLDETGYSYIYIDDSLAETMMISFSYADTTLTEENSNISQLRSYLSGESNFLYLVKTGKKINMNVLPISGYAMKTPFSFSTDNETINITPSSFSSEYDYFESNPFSTLQEEGSILTITGIPADEIPDVLAGISYYVSRIIKEKQSFSGEWTTQLLPPDVKNARISFGTDKSVEILLDKTTITGTYYMTTSGAELDIPGYYNDSLNGYEGYFKLKKDSDTTHYFYLASLSEGGIGEPTIGFYADGEAVATKDEKVPLNVKFVYFDSVPEEVTVYLKGYETDTELGSFTLNGKNSDWAPEVTDATIELDISTYEAGEYTLYVKAGEVVSNDLPVIITE